MSKKELILEGLNCASCATKIEDKVNKLEAVNKAILNFVTKTLEIEIVSPDKMDDVISQVRDIVKKLEPDVVVKEKHINKSNQKTLVLMGLVCTSCAAKIEDQIKKLDGVKDAFINFTTGRLVLEVSNKKDLNSISKKAIEIVNRIEPDVEVIDGDKNNSDHDHHHDHSHNENISKKELIRFSVGAVLFGIAVMFSFSEPIEFALFFVSYILIGGEVLLRAGKNILRGQVFDENFLMSIATIGAFAIKEYPEGVAVMMFYQVGEFFQGLAVNRSRGSIKSLMDIRPDYANLKTGDNVEQVSPEEVGIGDIIIVKPGEKVPLDGKIIEGSSMVDTSALTGESVPREVVSGEDVLSGFINKNGLLTIEVTKVFSESAVSKILDLVENASNRKAPTEQFITKFSRYYTPVVVFSAIALAAIPPIFIEGATFPDWLYRALIFLVISCPCALVVSIPLGFFGGIGAASRNGVLVKGGNFLEGLNNTDIVVFDKTGTLTKGTFKVTEIKAYNGLSNESLLEYAAYAESYSNHPIATSILKAYGKEINKDIIESYDEISGHGIKILLNKNEILVGNIRLMKMNNVKFENTDIAGTVVHVAVNKQYSGYILISDEIKDDSKSAIKALKKLGIRKTVILTGDNRSVGTKVAEELGLDEVYAELLPDQKVEKLEFIDKQKSSKGKLIFVGDGINDAPVLARADIGVAMGGLGSDAAIEAADVVLMTDEPSKLVDAIKIAKRTRKIVIQNIIFALGVKLFVLLLGSFGIATMWEAVFADVGVALIAILNAMRILAVKNK